MEHSISTDKSKINVDLVHRYISKDSYWGIERSKEEVIATIDNSMCFGMYTASHEQIGFARVVTDGVVFAYFMDIIIFNGFRNKGYGKKLVQHMMHHKTLKKIKTKALKTRDSHGFYKQFGFERIGSSPLWMANEGVTLTKLA